MVFYVFLGEISVIIFFSVSPKIETIFQTDRSYISRNLIKFTILKYAQLEPTTWQLQIFWSEPRFLIQVGRLLKTKKKFLWNFCFVNRENRK